MVENSKKGNIFSKKKKKKQNIITDINSEVDVRTQMSDGSSKTTNTWSSKASVNIFAGKANILPLAISVKDGTSSRGSIERGRTKDEFDEVLEYQQTKAE